jgi:hypothetical protein
MFINTIIFNDISKLISNYKNNIIFHFFIDIFRIIFYKGILLVKIKIVIRIINLWGKFNDRKSVIPCGKERWEF